MKPQTILLAVGAFGAAGLLFLLGKRASTGAAATAAAAVPAGAATWYGMDARPAQITQAAIDENWRRLNDELKAQPDFWI